MTRRHRVARVPILALMGLLALPSPGLAQSPASGLGQMSLEDLMNIEVTSASRKEQRVVDVAASIFVITHEDIRRSGMTTIPDLLRLAPGVDVAQVNSSKWAVSVRGFNSVYANKLLVLVDGRSVYNRLFSGVMWDTEDLMVDDIDRIEVIRGPGAALWGANAVNGVINIVTKRAADTQGGLVRVEAGRAGDQGAVRYGGTFGAAHYRLYSQWTGRDQSLLAAGTRANDASHSVTTGFRADWDTRSGAVMLQGDITAGQARALWPNLDPLTAALAPVADVPSDSRNGHVLARWTHARAGGASLQIQSFLDLAGRQEPVGIYDRNAFDVDAQYHTSAGAHQDLVAGAGFRFIDEQFAGRGGFSLTPGEAHSTLVSAFVHDEIAFPDRRLTVTLGSQVQYDSDSGLGIQPTARAIFKATPHQRLWAATSRALRTPSLSDRGIRIDLPPVPTASGLPLVVTALGNPAAETETFIDAEAGYRLDVGTGAWLVVSAFAGRYDHLTTSEPSAPVVQFVPSPRIVVTSQLGNQLAATTRGLEIAAHWAPVPQWRLDATYTGFRLVPTLMPTSGDTRAGTQDGGAPRHQWQLRSAFAPSPRATIGLAIFRVGRLERYQVEGYTRADLNVEWAFTPRLSLTAIGQNLFDAAHAEFTTATSLLTATQVTRSVSLRLRWVF